jgi:flagellar hook assembly protein FlgD
MTIYNILGEKIITLTNQKKTAGEYDVEWDGTDSHGKAVAGGLYFYRLQAGDRVATRKMILLK